MYDPKVSPEQVYSDLDYLGTRCPEENRQLVTVVSNPYEAIQQAHAVAVLTEWNAFRDLDWEAV